MKIASGKYRGKPRGKLGIVEDSSLLGCSSVSTGKQLTEDRRAIVFRVKQSSYTA